MKTFVLLLVASFAFCIFEVSPQNSGNIDDPDALLGTLVGFLLTQAAGSRNFGRVKSFRVEGHTGFAQTTNHGLFDKIPTVVNLVNNPDPTTIYPWMVWITDEEKRKDRENQVQTIIDITPKVELNALKSEIQNDTELRSWLEKKQKLVDAGKEGSLEDTNGEPKSIQELLLEIHEAKKGSGTISDEEHRKISEDLKAGGQGQSVIFPKFDPSILDPGSPMIEADLAQKNKLDQLITAPYKGQIIGADKSHLLINSLLGPRVIIGPKINSAAIMTNNILPQQPHTILPLPLILKLQQQYYKAKLDAAQARKDSAYNGNGLEDRTAPVPVPVLDVNSLSLGRDYVPYAFG